MADLRAVQTTRYHVHLPKLRGAGYTRCRTDGGQIRGTKSRYELLAGIDAITQGTGTAMTGEHE